MYKLFKFIVFIEINLLCSSLVNGMNVNKLFNDHRIWAGKIAAPNQFPHQVSLLILSNGFHHACGGSIIGPSKILCAAHCVTNDRGRVKPPRIYRIVAGLLVQDEFASTDMLKLKEIIAHPRYSPYTLDYDISIIMIEKKFNFDPLLQPNILPIPLENSTKINKELPCFISGWGKTESGNIANALLYAEVYIWDFNDCNEIYLSQAGLLITKRMICIRGKTVETATRGDSGGPLICNGFLLGVASFGIPFDHTIPSGYAYVPSVYKWILKSSAITLKFLHIFQITIFIVWYKILN